MDKYEHKALDMPKWMLEHEDYVPQSDKDTFVNKSILSLLKLLSRIKAQDFTKHSKYPVNVTLRLTFTFMLLILLSTTRSFLFVIIIIVYLLLVLSLKEAEHIVRILRLSLGMTLFTFFIMLPALLAGNSFSCIMITSKVFASITSVGILSHTTRWNAITGSLKRFYIPDMFILVLDITIKYIVMLGDFTLNMLYALKLRSVGRNRSKYTALSGIVGTMFIKSKEMAEEMYYAMECRGFTGEYQVYDRSKLTVADYIYIIINIGIILMFVYFWRGIK